MTEQQIKMGLATLDLTHPFWKAVQATLADAVESEMEMVTIPGLADSARQFNAGRLAHARDLQSALHTLVIEAHPSS